MIKKDNFKIKKKYLEKIKIFKKYNELYYSKSNPIVEDAIYDSLEKSGFSLVQKSYSSSKR